MYLPVSAVATATALLAASKLGVPNLAPNDLSLSTSSATLVARQNDAEPPPLVTSIQFVTSIAFVTSEPIPTDTATLPRTDVSSAPVPSTIEETRTSSEQPPTKTSTNAAATLTSSTSESTSSPTPTPHPDVNAGPWLSRGKIAGIVIGSVFGLVILGLTLYTLLAASRGINVCNCFGGCCGKRDDQDEQGSRDRLPSRLDDTYPHPDILESGPGEGYKAYRPARPVGEYSSLPLPRVVPQQGEMQQKGVGKLQRGYRGVWVGNGVVDVQTRWKRRAL